MNEKEFLGEELYTIIEKLFVQTSQLSKEAKEIVIETLREDATNSENKKVSLLLNGIADRIENL